MSTIKNFFQNITAAARTAEREEGQGTVEYILVTGLIVVALVVAAVGGLDGAVTAAIGRVTTAIGG